MKKVNTQKTFGSRLKYLFDNFQYIVNTAIDDEDVKRFVFYGFKHILKKERNMLFVIIGGLIALLYLQGLLRFIGLCVFLGAISYIGVQMIKFVSGADTEVFEEVKIELDQEEAIPQGSLTEYVTARINQKKHLNRRSK